MYFSLSNRRFSCVECFIYRETRAKTWRKTIIKNIKKKQYISPMGCLSAGSNRYYSRAMCTITYYYRYYWYSFVNCPRRDLLNHRFYFSTTINNNNYCCNIQESRHIQRRLLLRVVRIFFTIFCPIIINIRRDDFISAVDAILLFYWLVVFSRFISLPQQQHRWYARTSRVGRLIRKKKKKMF